MVVMQIHVVVTSHTCHLAMLLLVFISTGRHGYYVEPPPEAVKAHPHVADTLSKTGKVVTGGTIALNLTMLLRVLLEVGTSWCKESNDPNKRLLSTTRAQTQAHVDLVRSTHEQTSGDDSTTPLLTQGQRDELSELEPELEPESEPEPEPEPEPVAWSDETKWRSRPASPDVASSDLNDRPIDDVGSQEPQDTRAEAIGGSE
jgi:hypothetical protein